MNSCRFSWPTSLSSQKALCHARKAQRLTLQKFARWVDNPWVMMKWLSSYELFSYPEDKMNLSHITLVNYQEVNLWTCLKPVATILVPQLILTHRWFWFGLQTFSNSLVEPIFNHWEISCIASHFWLLLKDQMTRIPSQLLWGSSVHAQKATHRIAWPQELPRLQSPIRKPELRLLWGPKSLSVMFVFSQLFYLRILSAVTCGFEWSLLAKDHLHLYFGLI